MSLRITPAVYNDLVIYQGSTWTQTMRWLIGGVPVDFSVDIHEIRSYIRPSYQSNTPVVTMTSLSNIGDRVEVRPTLGEFDLIITATSTAAIPLRRRTAMVWDVELVTVSGHTWTPNFQSLFGVSGYTQEEVVTQLMRGSIIVQPEATYP